MLAFSYAQSSMKLQPYSTGMMSFTFVFHAKRATRRPIPPHRKVVHQDPKRAHQERFRDRRYIEQSLWPDMSARYDSPKRRAYIRGVSLRRPHTSYREFRSNNRTVEFSVKMNLSCLSVHTRLGRRQACVITESLINVLTFVDSDSEKKSKLPFQQLPDSYLRTRLLYLVETGDASPTLFSVVFTHDPRTTIHLGDHRSSPKMLPFVGVPGLVITMGDELKQALLLASRVTANFPLSTMGKSLCPCTHSARY
jgi:hypothetical protein